MTYRLAENSVAPRSTHVNSIIECKPETVVQNSVQTEQRYLQMASSPISSPIALSPPTLRNTSLYALGLKPVFSKR